MSELVKELNERGYKLNNTGHAKDADRFFRAAIEIECLEHANATQEKRIDEMLVAQAALEKERDELKKQLEQKTSDERGEAYWLEHYKNSTDAEKAEAVIAFRRSAIAYSRDNERLKAELAAVSASKTEK